MVATYTGLIQKFHMKRVIIILGMIDQTLKFIIVMRAHIFLTHLKKGLSNMALSQTGTILKHLKEHGSMTNADMWNRRIQRGSERIRELKKEGHLIITNHVDGPLWEYVYNGHVDDKESK